MDLSKTAANFFKKINKTQLLIIFIGLFLLSYRLASVPPHLNQDEMEFALNAHSIKTSLHDSYGNFLPFYFWHLYSFWATPIIVYLTSLLLFFLPLGLFSIRLTSALLGTFSIFLIILLVNQIANKKMGTIAGILLITTPAFVINSRVLLDNIYPIPFVLLWLYFLKRYEANKKNIYLFLCALSLGIGWHSYHAAKITMPIYGLFTLVYFAKEIRANRKILLNLALGGLLPLIIFLPWLNKHPDTLLNQVSYIGSLDKTVDSSRGLLGVFNFSRLSIFLSSYANYLSPKILIVEGDRSLIHSTGKVGAFLAPVSLLIIFGILKVLKTKNKFFYLILAGFLSYPIAPSIVNDPQRISRGLVVIPFAVLLSIFGIQFIQKSKEKALKKVLPFIFIFSALQFGLFINDYFGNYKIRSFQWFNGNIVGAYKSALNSTKIRKIEHIYIDNTIYFAEKYFYFTQKSTQTYANYSLFNPNLVQFTNFPVNSLTIIKPSNIPKSNQRQDHIKNFEKIETIRELNGNESFYIYYREK